MTLNGVVAVILSYFTEFDIVGANYFKEDKGRQNPTNVGVQVM